MSTDPARQAQLIKQIAQEMTDALGVCSVGDVQDALENSLDMHHAEIVEKPAADCHHRHKAD